MNLSSSPRTTTSCKFTQEDISDRHEMLSQFQSSYQRMEQSLQRLTDSIAAYNPSTSAADELVTADDAVNENLDQRTYSVAEI